MNLKKVTAILTADWHLTHKKPPARLDEDYIETQFKKIEFIKRLVWKIEQDKIGWPFILHAGDLFDKATPPVWFINRMLDEIDTSLLKLRVVPGNHDLVHHSMEAIWKSALFTLSRSRQLEIRYERGGDVANCPYYDKGWPKSFSMVAFPWGSKLQPKSYFMQNSVDRWVAVAHCFAYKGKGKHWEQIDDTAIPAKRLFDLGYDLVVTGHNHQPFVLRNKQGQLIVNPGSLTRMHADQVDHEPRVYLWDAEANEVEPVYVPIDEDMVSRDHLKEKEERDERIEAFVSRLDGGYEVGLSFEDNLNQFYAANKTAKSVKKIISEVME